MVTILVTLKTHLICQMPKVAGHIPAAFMTGESLTPNLYQLLSDMFTKSRYISVPAPPDEGNDTQATLTNCKHELDSYHGFTTHNLTKLSVHSVQCSTCLSFACVAALCLGHAV